MLNEEEHTLSHDVRIQSALCDIITEDYPWSNGSDYTIRKLGVTLDSEKETSCIVLKYLNLDSTTIGRDAYGNREQCNIHNVTDAEYVGIIREMPLNINTARKYSSAGFYAVQITASDMFTSIGKQHVLPIFPENEHCMVPIITFNDPSPLFYEPMEVRQNELTTIVSKLNNHLSCSYLNTYTSEWTVNKVNDSTGEFLESVSAEHIIPTSQSVFFAPHTLEVDTTYSIQRRVKFNSFTLERVTYLRVLPSALQITIDNGIEYTRYISPHSESVTLVANPTYGHDVSCTIIIGVGGVIEVRN